MQNQLTPNHEGPHITTRASTPKKWRKGWKSRKLTLIKRGDRIEIIPTQPIPPSELFGSIQIPDNVDFTDPHSLKKALPELQEH
jgi:hypothetical protein